MTGTQRTSPVLTTEEAADLLRVPAGWLEDKGREGSVPGRLKLGHYVRWDEAVLRSWLDAQVQPAVAVGRTELSKAQAKASKAKSARAA